MSIGIYKIENLINHKVYIGQSIHIEKRWQEHCQASSTSLISKDIQLFGKENFSFQILEECSQQELDQKEQFYIQKYNCIFPKGYNKTSGGQSGNNQNYPKYNLQIILNIIKDLKETSLTFREIAKKYSMDLSMIYYINRGDYHTFINECYPLRKVKDYSKHFYYCVDCGAAISSKATRCPTCNAKHQQIVERPSRDELKRLIRTISFSAIGRQYGVTDNAIRKWCKTYNLPYRVKDIKQYSDKEWSQI